jgi:hypothetical protein
MALNKLLLLLCLFFISCRKYGDKSHFYYYQIETTSPNVTATYKTIYGNMVTTNNIFSGWIYGWVSSLKKEKYYIRVENKDNIGLIKVRIIKDKDTIQEIITPGIATISNY